MKFSNKTTQVLALAKKMISEEYKRYHIGDLTSSQATKDYLMTELISEQNEVFGVIYLDNQHGVITFKKEFYGTIDSATVYPRVIAENALKNGANALILAHNHPSGKCSPSLADKQITDRLVKALGLIDIRVLDHIIIANDKSYSFAESGDL